MNQENSNHVYEEVKTGVTNWAGNIEYGTNKIMYPETISEVQHLVRTYDRIKVLGTRHCFNRIADSSHVLLSTGKMNRVLGLDPEKRTVTVDSGIRYGELANYLEKQGFALHNMASLPHITVAGSVTTATHGSGISNGNLATSVTSLELITADGSIRRFTREEDGDLFNGVVVGLGALGVIYRLSLAIQPSFKIRQNVFVRLPFIKLYDHFEEIMGAGYSVSLFTDWQNEHIDTVWIKEKEERTNLFNGSIFFGAFPATEKLHPIKGISAVHCTEQLGIPGSWHERLPHFKYEFVPSVGKELQSEYFIPQQHAVEAIEAIRNLRLQIGPHLYVSEIRTIAADELWMSPAYQQAVVAIHFTWKDNWPAVSALLPFIEMALSPFHPKPHWGKLFSMPFDKIGSEYEKFEVFRSLVLELDPYGKFRNKFLEDCLAIFS